MKKIILSLFILFNSLFSLAQFSADYNYSIGLRGFSVMQFPKILNQVKSQDYTKMFGNGALFKFNDNQINYRLSGNYYRDDFSFSNNCENCEIASGKITDYSFKIGFEKNINYSRVQPYFGFDLGYRSSQFSGMVGSASAYNVTNKQNAETIKNGVVLTPFIGLKINIVSQLSIFAESSLDFYYSYEKQELAEANGAGRTVNTFTKWEYLLNPVSAGLQFSLNGKN
ncbi:hypothetical protein [Pedobacter mucosus]|uniref:hypothetical protein n=1 Tax=Pedobacter mucosus TaxID=2895286 RepID=UPI001EE3F8FB|nr:hypothetical protein [Pedobacter mucosus]UKT65134.1 hypothetical protein LOK61_04985 [Pedobacter mucosus]